MISLFIVALLMHFWIASPELIDYHMSLLTPHTLWMQPMSMSFLAIIFALDKFICYLLCFHIIVFTDHATLKYLLKKLDAKPRLIRWMLLLREFDIEIRNRNVAENMVVDHLSKIEGPVDSLPIRESI